MTTDALVIMPSGALYLYECRPPFTPIPFRDATVIRIEPAGAFRIWADLVGLPVEPRRPTYQLFAVEPRGDADRVAIKLMWM